jgi:hypothetical protein
LAPIKVYCLPEEKAGIEANARATGMSAARFLREGGQGYRVRSVVDYQQVREMVRISVDLGRLGGLLKLWLGNDVRTAHLGPNATRALLRRIEANQNELSQTMRFVARPRAKD